MSTIPPARPTPPPTATPITKFRDENRFLSNFWNVPGGVSLKSRGNEVLTGPTVEHVFQAVKTFDRAAQQQILAAPNASEAKRLGQQVELRPDWDQVKIGVMARLQGSKFSNPDLARALLATEDAELVEGNHWCDDFWGRCSCATHAGTGSNWLGHTLMILRSTLRLGV